MPETRTTKNFRTAARALGYATQRLEVRGALGVPDLLVQPPGCALPAAGAPGVVPGTPLLWRPVGAGWVEAKYAAKVPPETGLHLSTMRPTQPVWITDWVRHPEAWASVVASVGQGRETRWYVWRGRPAVAWVRAIQATGVDRWACASCVGALPDAMLLATACMRYDDPRVPLPPLPC